MFSFLFIPFEAKVSLSLILNEIIIIIIIKSDHFNFASLLSIAYHKRGANG